MAKNKGIQGVPPWLPIDWRAWKSSPTIQSMSMTQRGIALEIMIEQWVTGNVPRNAWDLAKLLQADFQTTRRFLLSYSKFLVCCECGNSWTPVDCKCGASTATGRCESPKLKNFFIDAKSELPLGTTKGKETYIEPKETTSRGVYEEDEPVTPTVAPKTCPEVSEIEEIEDASEEATEEQTTDAEEANPQAVAKAFMTAFDIKMKKRYLWSWDLCYEAFEEFLKTHKQSDVLRVIKQAASNSFYKHGAKTVNADKQRPWDWFIEKYEDMVDKFEADEEFQRDRVRKAKAAAGGHAAVNPELHTDGDSWTKDAVKI